MRFKKIRGHKRRWKQIEAWRLNNTSLFLADYLLNTSDRYYLKIRIFPWNGFTHNNSAIPQPNGKTKQLFINALIDIYNDWKVQLDILGQPYYLKIWLYEPNFADSQIVCAIGDSIEFYDTTFLEGDDEKTLDLKQYGALASKMQKLQWKHYIDEEHYENSFVGTPEIYATLKDYNETLRWFSRTMKKPHRTTLLDTPTDTYFEFYSFEKGNVWLGGE
jgi:hypothetical protein